MPYYVHLHLNILYAATLAMRAKVVVELGTGFGHSALAFSDALKLTGGTLYTIDKDYDEGMVAYAKKYLKERDNIVMITSDSIEAANNWNKPIDILFCDSDHSYNHVYGELVAWERFNPKIIFIHDTLSREGEKADPYFAAKDYAEKRGKKFVNLGIPLGLGIII